MRRPCATSASCDSRSIPMGKACCAVDDDVLFAFDTDTLFGANHNLTIFTSDLDLFEC